MSKAGAWLLASPFPIWGVIGFGDVAYMKGCALLT